MPETFISPVEPTAEERTQKEIQGLEPEVKPDPVIPGFVRAEDDWRFEDDTYQVAGDYLNPMDHLAIDKAARELHQTTVAETDPGKRKSAMEHLKRYEQWRGERSEKPYHYITLENTSKRAEGFEKKHLIRYAAMFRRGADKAHDYLPKDKRQAWLNNFSALPNPSEHKQKALLTGVISAWSGVPQKDVSKSLPSFLRAFREHEIGIQGDANEATMFGEVSRWLDDKVKQKETRHGVELDISNAVDDSIFEGGSLVDLQKRVREGVKRSFGEEVSDPRQVDMATRTYRKRAQFMAPHLPQARRIFDLVNAREKGGKVDRGSESLEKELKRVASMKKEDRAKLLYTIYQMAERQSGQSDEGVGGSILRGSDDYMASILDAMGSLSRSANIEGETTEFGREFQKNKADYDANIDEFRQDLRGIKDIVSRIKSDNWFMQGVYDASRSIPYTLSAAVPYAGIVLNAAAMSSQADADLRRAHPEMSRGDRAGIATTSGAVQSLIERASFRGVVGKMPKLDSALSKLGVAGTATMRIGRGFAVEYAEEAFQEATPAVIQNLAIAANKDIPEVSADEWVQSFRIFAGDSRTAGAVLPLAIIMGGGTTIIDRMGAGKARELLGNFDAAWLSGVSKDEATAISSEKDVFKAQKMLKSAVDSKTDEELAANRAEARKDGAERRIIEAEVKKSGTDLEKASLEAEQARRDYAQKYGAAVNEKEDGAVEVVYGETSNKPTDTFDNVEDAVLAADAHDQDTYAGFLNELRTSSDNIEAMRLQTKRNTKAHEGGETRLDQDVKSLPEYAAESAANMDQAIGRVQIMLDHAGVERGATVADLEQVRVLGQVQLREKARGYIASIAKDGNISTVIEEGAEGWLGDSIKHGIIESSQVKEELIDYQSFSGDTFTKATTGAEMSDQEMVEGFSRLAQAHMFNKGQEGAIQGRLGELLRSLTEFFRTVLKAAEGLIKLKREGLLSENMESWLDAAVGMDSDQQIERMAVAEVKQIAEDAGADSTFSIDFKGLDKAPSHYSYVRSSNISQKLEDIANREGIEFVEPSAGTPTRIAEFERDSGLKVGFFRKVREVATAQVDERTSAFVDPAQPFALLLNSEVDSPIDGLLAHEVMHAAQRDEQSGYKELEQDLVGLLSEGDAQDIEVFLEHRKYKKSQWEKERIAYIAGASMSHHQEMEISSLENVTAIKERIGKFFADSGQLNPNSIEGVDDADLSTFSLAPKGDPIVERVRGLMRDPDTRLVVYGKMADKLASIRRDADIHLVINGSSTVRPATAEYRTATSLRQEAAEMRRKAVSEAENKIYDTMGEILTNEEITRLSDQPVTSRILEEGGIESKSAAIKRHGNDLLIGGEYDDMAGLPPMYYGGTESTDQMAGILFNHGLITENSVPAMLEAIDKEITSVASNKELLTKAKARLRSVREDAKKESNEWLADKLKEQERDHSPRAILMRTMASYNAIISVLPAEIRGQVGGIMKMAGAKSESAAIKGLLERLERADNLLEKHLQKEYREKVSKAVDRAMPSKGKTSSVAKGKMVYNFTDELKKIAEVLSLSSMEVADAVEDAATRHEKSQTGEEIDEEAFADSTEDLARLVMYGNIHNTGTPVSASQMAEALNELEVLIRDGRTRWQARQEQEKARLSGVRNKTTDVITGGKGRVPSAEILKNKTKKQKSDYLKREHLRNMSFEFLLNSISRNDKSSETLGSYINKHFAPLVHTATHREHIQLAKRRDNLLQAVSSIYGIDSTKQGWKGKMEKLLAKHAKINFKSGVVRVEHEGSRTVEVTREDAQLAIDGITKHVHHGYSFVELTKKEIGELKTMLKEDASKERGQAKKKFKLVQKQEGVLREQALSQDIGMFLSMMHIQDDLRPAMEAHGYDSGVMDEIEGFLTDESKALRAWLFLEYKNIHPYVNKVFREHFGYSLPSKKNYAPAKFNHAGRDIKELIDEGHGVQSTTPGFAIERIRHKSAPRFDVGAVEAYMMHIEEAEHFVNWYEVVKELRSVFMNRDVRDHIKEQHGTEAYKLILERIDTFAQGGTMEGKNKFADHLRKTFTVAKLSYNWGVFLKQLTSLPAYSFDIPVAQYVKYQAEFFANPVKGYKLISGKDYTKQRFTQGYDRDIMAVMNAMNGGKGKLQKAAEFGMMFGRLGDIIPVIVGGYASYRYNYEQAIKSGKSEQEAGVMATLAFEMSTDRAQQSGNLKDQSHYSMGGSWSRVLTMFQTSPRQYYSNMAEAILDAKAGRKGGAKRAAKQAFIAHVVLPSLFYWTSVFTRNAFRDDDDKESLDEMLNGWYLSMLMGPTSGIFLWGQIVNEVVSGYEYSVPIMEWAGEIGDGGRRLHKMYSSYTDDDEATNVSPEDVIGFLDNMATAGSLAIGRSATWYDIGTSRAKSFGFTKDDVEYLAMSKEDQAVQDASSVHSKLYKEKLPDRETDSDAYDNAQDARFKALADEYLQIRNENRAEWPEIEKKLIEKGKLPKAVKEIMD